MADRYAILPAATTSLWSATSTWSASSGGATGASVPTSADNVYVDANSVGGANAILSVDATAYCLGMDWTGATNTPTLAGTFAIRLYGSLTFIAAMTHTFSSAIDFYGATPGKTITANGPLACHLTFRSQGDWALQDEINIGTQTIILILGTLNTNGQTVTCGPFYDSGTGTRALTLGTSIFNCTSWSLAATGMTLTANTSSIRVTGTGAFAGGGLTYYEVQLNGTAHTISGSNTFTNLKLLPAGIQTITFTDGTLQTTINFSRSAGTSVITLQGTSTAGWALSKASGRLLGDYLALSYSNASGGASFYARNNSVNTVGNTGWMFREPVGAYK